MLRGKRAVITGGGGGFGQALCVWLAREGVDVDFSARRVEDIEKTCALIAAEGGVARGYLCDLAQPESISQFSSQVLRSEKPIDILILNAAQWLSGTIDEQSSTEIVSTVSSGLTGSILLTQALLPGLRRSRALTSLRLFPHAVFRILQIPLPIPLFLPANTGSAALQRNCQNTYPKKIFG